MFYKVIKAQGIDCTRYSLENVLTEESTNYTRYSLHKVLTSQGTHFTRYSLLKDFGHPSPFNWKLSKPKVRLGEVYFLTVSSYT